MSDEKKVPAAKPAGAKPTKRGSAKRLGSADPAPQDGAAGALPEGAANPSELLDRPGHRERAMTQSVKVFYPAPPSGQLRCKEVGVREGKMVEADEEGVDQLVDLPGPVQVADSDRRINGIELKAGEKFILP